MTAYAVLLRAVNVGKNNRVAMADLRTLLEGLGHGEVATVLNSGNAVFTSDRSTGLAAEVEAGLRGLGVSVGAAVVTCDDLMAMVEQLPARVAATAYPLVGVLLGPPTGEPADFAPDVWELGPGCVWLGYATDVHTSRMTTPRLEKGLGTGVTARTPATLLRLLAARRS